ncbi:hypothetical protein F4810DRAFT_710786 [Camillea tinctor]|nr:hypothetical protein F4810DRAFT_710786 [Camillea tinctor]
MTSHENTIEQQDESCQPEDSGRTNGWEPARHQQYYASRALPIPPRPQSSSSSIYEPEDGPRRQPTPKGRLVISPYHDGIRDSSYLGPFDEDAYQMIKQQEVVSPQPIQPDYPGLFNVEEHDEFGISPVTPPAIANTLWTAATVSPLSEATSELEQMLSTSHELWGRGSPTSIQVDRRHSEFGHSPRMADPLDSLNPFVQKLNLRHSDPGSPKEARGFGESGPGPSIDYATTSNAVSSSVGTQGGEQASHEGPAASSNGRNHEVLFTTPRIDTFSKRTQEKARPNRIVPPPPLKLSERPIVGNYIKTPFPPLTEADTSQKSVHAKDEANVNKKQNRISSFGSVRGPRRMGTWPKNEAKASATTQESRPLDMFTRASPVPKVKNMLSRAKQGLGIISDEEKKERRNEDIKRKIRPVQG